MRNSNSNTRQAIWIALGSIASFGFALVSSMFLSRLFDKFEYGTYKQVMYVYSTLLIIFTLGLPQAFGYFLPRVPIDQGRDVVKKITILLTGMGFIFSLILFLTSSYISSMLRNPDLAGALRIFSPTPLLMLPTMGIDSIYATYKQTYISAIYTVITKVIQLLGVILPVLLINNNVNTALIGFVISSLLTAIVALFLKNRPFRSYSNLKTSITFKNILDFSFPLVFAGISAMIINSTDQFFISRYFGTIVFADFSNGAMELPFVGIIISACSTVLFPVFSKYSHDKVDAKEIIYPIWMSVFNKTAMLIYPMVVFCWFYSDSIMDILYGSQYINSGIYFKIKLFANLFTLIAFTPVILAIGKTSFYAKVQFYGAIILIIAEYCIIYLFHNSYLVVVISVVCHIGRIIILLNIVAQYFRIQIIKLFPLNLIAKIIIPSIFFLYILQYIVTIESYLINVSVSGVLYILFMSIISKLFKLNYISLIKSLIK